MGLMAGGSLKRITLVVYVQAAAAAESEIWPRALM